MKRICILVFLFVGIVTAKAYDFKVDGIYYNIISLSDRTVEVTHRSVQNLNQPFLTSEDPSDYTGDIVIPESVEFNGNTFKVIAIGHDAFAYSTISSIKFPSCLKTVGDRAFKAVMMKRFVIPNTMESINSIPEILDELIIEDLAEGELPYGNVLSAAVGDTGMDQPRWKYVYVGRTCVLDYVRAVTNNAIIKYGYYIPDDQVIRDIRQIGDYNKKITFVLTYPLPPMTNNEFSKQTYMKAHIRVPQSSLKYYKEDPIWSLFFDLQGY